MVQNKELEKEKDDNNIKNGDAHEETLLLNGKLNEKEDYSEDEDDYLQHLLVVPSLDRSVCDRNMSLISESLLNFYTAIESRKEYEKIKQELMGDLVPTIKCEIDDKSKVAESTLNVETNQEVEDKSKLAESTLNVKIEDIKNDLQSKLDANVPEIEVSDEIKLEIRKFTILFPRARFVPENPPNMYDQFVICRRCTIFFKTRKFCKMHNALNHRKKRAIGDLNTSTDASPPKVRKRIRSGGKGKLLICDLCSKTFKVKTLIRSHMNSHTQERPLACSLCPYAGKRSYDLKKHHFVHHNPERIKKKRTRRRKCDKCDEILEDKKAYRLHLRLNHREKIKRKPRIYKKCEKCQEAIYTKKGYKIHMKQNHSDFLYIKCERCNRRFKTNFRLKKHKSRYVSMGQDCRTQIRVRKPKNNTFGCEHCSSKFTLKSHLSLHMKKHELYKCENCDMEFRTQFSLKYHEFSHLDTEPKCIHCAKVFSSEQKFSNHLKKKVCKVNGLTNGHVENGISI